MVVVKLLRDVVIRSSFHRLHRGLHLGNGGDHDDFGEAVVFLDDLQNFEPVDPWQPYVEEDQVDVFPPQDR